VVNTPCFRSAVSKAKQPFPEDLASLKAEYLLGSIHEPSKKHTVVTLTFGGIDMMKRLQLLFECLADISQQESELLNAAHRIFASRCELPPMVELPACWRRNCRVTKSFHNALPANK
jgi:hypothetical protein